MNKKLLIDGNALMYKAFFASFKSLNESFGRDQYGNPTNALRTFSQMILNIAKQFNEHDVLIAFDERDLKTFRNEFDFYKSGRNKTPDELNQQRELIFKFIDLFGFQYISHPSLEADDIIGVLSNRFKDKYKIDIITSDKDLLQLVSKNVNVHISKTGVTDMLEYNINNFSELFNGLNPKQIIDLKGLMGDNSDNLPGIKGIGPKTAIELITKYDNLECIIENINELKPSLQIKFNEQKEMAILCKRIATIITDFFDLNIQADNIKNKKIKKLDIIDFLKARNIYNVAKKIEEEW